MWRRNTVVLRTSASVDALALEQARSCWPRPDGTRPARRPARARRRPGRSGRTRSASRRPARSGCTAAAWTRGSPDRLRDASRRGRRRTRRSSIRSWHRTPSGAAVRSGQRAGRRRWATRRPALVAPHGGGDRGEHGVGAVDRRRRRRARSRPRSAACRRARSTPNERMVRSWTSPVGVDGERLGGAPSRGPCGPRRWQ